MDISKAKKQSIKPTDSLLNALKKMDCLGVKSLLVTNEDEIFAGILSIGDIQRAIIRNDPLSNPVSYVLRSNPRVAGVDDSIEYIKEIMNKFRMEFIPVLDEKKNIIKIFFWEEIFVDKEEGLPGQFSLPVVIMAGGVGARLQPFTNVLPKPLFPYKEKTIIEEIIHRFTRHGCRDFYVSTNYKAGILELYLQNLNLECDLTYIHEDKPLGTIGSMFQLKEKIHGTFIVTNCDILINQDYSEILDYHNKNQNAITIISVLKHFPIPYGVLETAENGLLVSLKEKPELTFKINSGMYILESRVLNEIPGNTFYHMTELIEKVYAMGDNIGVFPVSEGSWKDIGNWDEFLKLSK